MSCFPYALYLDNKKVGAAYQLVRFYQDAVFSTNDTLVYVIKHPRTYKKLQRIFAEGDIPYRFVTIHDLALLKNQIIFYPFNASSNCLFVANRNLQHVFITHGESNKLSSVSPLIRIYDYVVMAGQLSLERYLKSGVFNMHDIQGQRLIQLGNTFIGKTGFNLLPSTDAVLCYAPTWEGKSESENYSSLLSNKIVNYLFQKAQELNLKTIVIKPHPNTGQRKKIYLKGLFDLAQKLITKDLDIKLYCKELPIDSFKKIFLSMKGIDAINDLTKYHVVHAFADISAMETQFINEKIPHTPLYYSQKLRCDMPTAYLEFYNNAGINLSENFLPIKVSYTKEIGKLKAHLFSYTNPEWNHKKPSVRVQHLASMIRQSGQITNYPTTFEKEFEIDQIKKRL